MDCNRDEAIRARELAEEKMQSNDFEGARRIALKAQQLFSELDNISQLLAICDVHISAQRKLYGSEKDWFGILQVESGAAEAVIKKQYRKLALILHPDKNKFPGAEAAFKLIVEAHKVLTDQQSRSKLELMCSGSNRVFSTKAPPHQTNRNPPFRRQYSGPNSIPSVSSYQATEPGSSNGLSPFWTCCPFCITKYQYYRDYVNKTLLCQKCLKAFTAYDIGPQVVPPGSNYNIPAGQGAPPPSNRTEPLVFQQKMFSNQEPCKVGVQNTGSFGSFYSGTEPVKKNENTRKSGTSGKIYRKMERKKIIESSENSDSSSCFSEENVIFEENGSHHASSRSSGLNAHRPRRSSRQRNRVSYNESESDDDFVNLPKRSRWNETYADDKDKEKKNDFWVEESGNNGTVGASAATSRGKGTVEHNSSLPDGIFPDMKHENEEHDINKEEFLASESAADSVHASDPAFYDCPEPEFYDFDKDKAENCFNENQMWACYDTLDGMPRFYALVRKVLCHDGFKLRITWLEARPKKQNEVEWEEGGLPVACGNFILGSTEETSDRLSFSHQVPFRKGSSRGSYTIYPSVGEIWAIFKDWDIGWSSDVENHRSFEYEFVEVLSNFDVGFGINVAYLDKLKGFVSLFQSTVHGGVGSFVIPPSDLFQFSHKVPSYKLSGNEREGVPKGSYELDPASLPNNVDEFCHSGRLKMETQSMDGKVNGPCPKSPENKLNSMPGSEKMSAPRKCVKLNGKNDTQNEIFQHQRSLQEQSSTNKMLNQVNPCPSSSMKASSTPPSFCPDSEVSDFQFHDFRSDKSEDKFEPEQIWALFSTQDVLPRKYAQVRKIESSPFGLHVLFLEECSQRKYNMHPVCCGAFKVGTGKTEMVGPRSFSHLLRPIRKGKNTFEIYPKAGEIWALYKNWKADLSLSELEKCGYDIVEVLEEHGGRIVVANLQRLGAFKSVFMCRSIGKPASTPGILEIERVDFARFSHQIPAFKLSDEVGGRLRGFWELDPASIPGNYTS